MFFLYFYNIIINMLKYYFYKLSINFNIYQGKNIIKFASKFKKYK